MSAPSSAGSRKALISSAENPNASKNPLLRDPSTLTTNDLQFEKVLEPGQEVPEETIMQIEIINSNLARKDYRSTLASKSTCLTRRWQTALVSGLTLLALAAGIGGLGYWISIPKVITQPFLLYGETCYMNSRSCDDTRGLWCPAGTCICIGNYQWNATAQNCSCGANQIWTGFRCQGYGSYGDPCNSIPCRTTLTCLTPINQTYTTGQAVCVCDNTTYLATSGGSAGTCVPRLTYNDTCQTRYDCLDSIGLSCASVGGTLKCQCSSTSYWNGSYCVQNALGWQVCNPPGIPCDTTRGLTCQSGICDCDSLSFWDNVTTLTCQSKRTYGVGCQFNFQCNTTVNLTCPTTSTGCNCYLTSFAGMCDCAAGQFWDGQRCITRHIFNGTCPGQYACGANLVCFLGHCICPGNMVWNNPTPNTCDCPTGTTWNSTSNTCA